MRRCLLGWLSASPARAGETLHIGLLKSAGSTAVYLAQERGYFAAEGIDAQFLFFDAAEPIAVAAVAGGIEIGSVGTSAGMFSLGAQGVLKLIGGQSREYPGFQTLAFLEFEQGLCRRAEILCRSRRPFDRGGADRLGLALQRHLDRGEIRRAARQIRILPLQSIPTSFRR